MPLGLFPRTREKEPVIAHVALEFAERVSVAEAVPELAANPDRTVPHWGHAASGFGGGICFTPAIAIATA